MTTSRSQRDGALTICFRYLIAAAPYRPLPGGTEPRACGIPPIQHLFPQGAFAQAPGAIYDGAKVASEAAFVPGVAVAVEASVAMEVLRVASVAIAGQAAHRIRLRMARTDSANSVRFHLTAGHRHSTRK